MLVVKSHDDQTGTISKLDIPGEAITKDKVSRELESGKYPSHFAFTHRGANLEVNFQKTEEFCEFATWVLGEIRKSSQT